MHPIRGVGVGRETMTEEDLKEREFLLVENQKFGIAKNPKFLENVERIKSPKFQAFFDKAVRVHQLTKEDRAELEGVILKESGGDENAESPTGPKGVAQFTEDTGLRAGLDIRGCRTLYKKVLVLNKKKKWVPKLVWRRGRRVQVFIAYDRVCSVDERLDPEKAIVAAGGWFKFLGKEFPRKDLRRYGWHSGEGAARRLKNLGMKLFPGEEITMPKLFFRNHPDWNRELYKEIRFRMKKDYGPVYPFGVEASIQILAMSRSDPKAFYDLAEFYRNKTRYWIRVKGKKEAVEVKRAAPYRFWAWYPSKDFPLRYKTLDDLKKGRSDELLAPIFDDPEWFGFQPRTVGGIGANDLANQEWYLQNSPAANGLLIEISYEMQRFDEKTWREFDPLDPTSLVRHLKYQGILKEMNARTGLPSHLTGQVFDVSYQYLSDFQNERLRFVLDDIGYMGHLSYAPEKTGTHHIAVSPLPASQELFAQIYEEAWQVYKVREEDRRKAAEAARSKSST